VAYGRIWVRSARRWVRGILGPQPVDLVEALRLPVVRLQFVVADRPSRRHAAPVFDLAEVLAPQPEQSGAVKLRIAADAVARMRMEHAAIGVPPHLRGVILAVDVDCFCAPVVFLTRHVIAALEKQNALAGRRQGIGERATTGTASNDDDVVMVHRHAPCPRYRHRKMHR